MKLYRNGSLYIDPCTNAPIELTPPCRVAGRRVYDTDPDGNERLRISGYGPWTLEEGN